MFNGNWLAIGYCDQCGGIVSIPIVSHGESRIVPRCERCDAVADESANLRVIKMIPSEKKPVKTMGSYDSHWLCEKK